MSTVPQVLKALKSKGSEHTRKMYERHGATGPEVYGVKIADMKTIAKSIKGDQELAMELYETGHYEAMYLAGMVADGSKMTKRQLDAWAREGTAPPPSQVPTRADGTLVEYAAWRDQFPAIPAADRRGEENEKSFLA